MKLFTIYGRPGCGFCTRARQICLAKNLEHQYIDIWEENISKEDLSRKVGEPVYTVPQIFHGDTYVGGCEDLEVYLAK
ncbi:MAG: GrxA family glutaredoxin [Gammaproteobacteria bacterium]|nr:GrxA family glutaredoxin [Gammaproteobacteria bacterium]MDH5629137.1 GrxA family glutaredoxin [Gammaproteobacteria bacterium]